MKIVEVAFDIPVDRTFDYLPGKFSDKIHKGARVRVSFGRQRKTGLVVKIKECENKSFTDCKNILKVYDDFPLIGEEQFAISSFIAERYFSSLGQALFTMVGGLPLKYHSPASIPSKQKTELFASHSYSKRYLQFLSHRRKGEVYKEIISSTKNGSILFLFPESSMAEEYYKEFSSIREGQVVLFHSELPKSDKLSLWLRMLTEQNLVIIGTRIAVFSPVEDIKLIVVDKANDPSYNEQQTPKYNACEVADFRCLYHQIPLIIGEVCFSLGEYLDIHNGKGSQEIYNGEALPSVHTFFMSRKTTDKDITFFVSDTLSLFEEALIRKEKVALIHNRKGSSNLLRCEKCEYRFTCSSCGSAMILSDDGKNLLCRFCKTTIPFEKRCPSCGSKKIGERVYGIEKMFRVLKDYYPDFRTLKFTGNVSDVSEDFDIIIGTSAVKKVMRQQKFSLVVIISGESFLNIPDYNSEEKFFIMVSEIRSMINNPECNLIIQTRSPNLEVYKALVENNPDIFYRRELDIRRQLLYPPFVEIVKIEVKSAKKDVLERKKDMVERYIKEKGYELFYSGPSFPPVKKGKGVWKYLIRFKDNFDRNEIKRMAYEIDAVVESNPSQI
ncbi:MAG: primosomal protein N' [Candidatus Ratteibacteria bacterium]|nr:primosomal protein N' [Candidatus Ratteibacteria bacterium]